MRRIRRRYWKQYRKLFKKQKRGLNSFYWKICIHRASKEDLMEQMGLSKALVTDESMTDSELKDFHNYLSGLDEEDALSEESENDAEAEGLKRRCFRRYKGKRKAMRQRFRRMYKNFFKRHMRYIRNALNRRCKK